MREGYVSPQNPERDFSNNQNIIVKTDKNTQYDIDSVLKLNFNREDCYFFDINSEERLRIWIL